MTYTISEVAQKLGISVHTIRYYHAQGLLPTLKQSENSHRVFTEQDIILLSAIVERRAAGMTIKDMRELVDIMVVQDDVAAGKEILLRRRAEIVADIARQQEGLAFLDTLIQTYDEELDRRRKNP